MADTTTTLDDVEQRGHHVFLYLEDVNAWTDIMTEAFGHLAVLITEGTLDTGDIEHPVFQVVDWSKVQHRARVHTLFYRQEVGT